MAAKNIHIHHLLSPWHQMKCFPLPAWFDFKPCRQRKWDLQQPLVCKPHFLCQHGLISNCCGNGILSFYASFACAIWNKTIWAKEPFPCRVCCQWGMLSVPITWLVPIASIVWDRIKSGVHFKAPNCFCAATLLLVSHFTSHMMLHHMCDTHMCGSWL